MGWEYFTPDTVDLEAGTLTFVVDHFSAYSTFRAAAKTLVKERAHSQALADLASKKVLDKVADQVVTHILKDRLGLSESSATSQVLSMVLKDTDYAGIREKFAAGNADEAMKDLTFLTAKNAVAAVESKNLSAALMNATKARRFGAEAHEALREKLIAGAGETPLTRTLKEISGAGSLDEWGLNLDTATQAAGNLAEGNYREATRIIGESVADTFLITKLGKVGVEVIQYEIDSWRDGKLEAAYQAWKTGASDKGYPLDARGDIDAVWVKMGDSLRRQVNIDALNMEDKIRREGGLPPLTEKEADLVRARVARDLEAQWKERANSEDREAKITAEMDAMLALIEGKGWIDASFMLWSDRSDEFKVHAILSSWDIIRGDIMGKRATTVTGQMSQAEIADLIREMWSKDNLAEGRKAYAERLFKQFGIDVRAKYGVAVPTPTPKAPRGKFVLVKREVGEFGDPKRNTGTVSGNTAQVPLTGFQGEVSSWTCSWPEPPRTLETGQEWGGTVTVSDAGSKPSENYWAFGGADMIVGWTRPGVDPGSTTGGDGGASASGTVAPVPGQSSEPRKSFSVAIPDDALSLHMSARCNARTAQPDGKGGEWMVAGVDYSYELRK